MTAESFQKLLGKLESREKRTAKMKFGVVIFPGSNCDYDTFHVLKDVLRQETTFLWHKDHDLKNVDCVVLPGGFSYGDYLRSGGIAKFSPLMQEVKNYDDVDFLFVVSDNATVDYWVSLVNAQFGLPMGAGVTAVMAPKSYSFLQTGQMVGLLGGMKGAAEYEKLSRNPGRATRGMDPQSIIHLLIIIFIVLGNVGYFVSKRSKV